MITQLYKYVLCIGNKKKKEVLRICQAKVNKKKRGIVLLEGKKAVKPFLHHKEKKKRRRMQKQTKKKAAAGVDTDIFI